MNNEKKTITVKGKLYGVFFFDGRVAGVRSESNPHKTPYLKPWSKRFAEVVAAIAKAEAKA